MAEVEQASLKSEQLSDKSSSPALPDDLSLDEHTAFQLLAQEDQVCTGAKSGCSFLLLLSLIYKFKDVCVLAS